MRIEFSVLDAKYILAFNEERTSGQYCVALDLFEVCDGKTKIGGFCGNSSEFEVSLEDVVDSSALIEALSLAPALFAECSKALS